MNTRNHLFEVTIGALVLVLTSLFCLYAYHYVGLSEVLGETRGYRLTIAFNSVDGVVPGTDVRIAGVKVGSVLSSQLDKKKLMPVVTIRVDSEVKLPKDSNAKITSYGIFGKNYIALIPGGSKTYLSEGDRIVRSQGSVDIISLISAAFFNASGSGGKKAGEEGGSQKPSQAGEGLL